MPRNFLRLLALAVLVLTALGVSRTAPAQSKVTEVLIGSVLPLTGTFANYGQQYLWSAQTAEDIVNNDYPDLQVPRSEEHTSELQSQSNLVCRLLLEKKKKNIGPPSTSASMTI